MITLTSDFGLRDPYVAEMKGVILTINPNATIVDITHEVEKFNVRMGAFILASSTPYFPKGAVHVAVVDPGVGTRRSAIVIQAKKDFFVGPDNGLLMLAAKNQGVENIWQLTNSKFMLPQISNTFHGRDIFAPAAAYLEQGVLPSKFGPEVKDPVIPEFAQVKHSHGSSSGEILHIDGFGNIITNLTVKDLPRNDAKKAQIEMANTSLQVGLVKTYAEAKPKEPVVLIGSHGFLEIALNQASAAEKFSAKAGDKITVSFS
jgi:hypothetical protein